MFIVTPCAQSSSSVGAKCVRASFDDCANDKCVADVSELMAPAICEHFTPAEFGNLAQRMYQPGAILLALQARSTRALLARLALVFFLFPFSFCPSVRAQGWAQSP